jgi:hypothetical protein
MGLPVIRKKILPSSLVLMKIQEIDLSQNEVYNLHFSSGLEDAIMLAFDLGSQ